MSVATEISRLQTAKSDIKTAIEAKGVEVPSSAKIDVYDDYISQISTGKQKEYDNVPLGVYAYYADGTLKTYEEADTSAIGVAIISTNSKFVAYKTDLTGIVTGTANTYNEYADGALDTWQGGDPSVHLNGYKATLGMLYNNGNINNRAQYLCKKYFNGLAHLPAAGQLQLIVDNKEDFFAMRTKIGGDGYKYTHYMGSTYRDRYSEQYFCIYSDASGTNFYVSTFDASDASPRCMPCLTLDYDYDNLEPIQ